MLSSKRCVEYFRACIVPPWSLYDWPRSPAVRHHTSPITHLPTKCHRIQSRLIIDLWCFAAVLCHHPPLVYLQDFPLYRGRRVSVLSLHVSDDLNSRATLNSHHLQQAWSLTRLQPNQRGWWLEHDLHYDLRLLWISGNAVRTDRCTSMAFWNSSLVRIYSYANRSIYCMRSSKVKKGI